jgi:cyclophilin family peptidyl-prolyl cis-trans isomerase
MSKGYIFAYSIVTALLFCGLIFWTQYENKTDPLHVPAIDPALVNLPGTTAAAGYAQDQYAMNPGQSIGPQPQTIIQTNHQNNMNATFHTNKGDITLELFAVTNPVTVENFLKLAQSGFYDGVKFHRVIKGFMIQGGDPLTKDESQSARWGTGGPGYQFNDEIGPQNSNALGTISMANAGPNTNGSQFFINTKDNNFLDKKHTVFGRVTGGMDVVQAIENVKIDPSNDRPLEPVVIQSISIQ